MKKRISALLSAGLMLLAPASAFAEEQWLWPVEGFYNLSSGFGQRSFSYHKGIDIAGPQPDIIKDEPILASKSGIVIAAEENCPHNYGKSSSCGCGGGYGNYVYVQHADGLVTRYGHMTDVLVAEGQAVKQGDVLGTVGSTGSSGGHHLHFEIRDTAGEPVNPMPMNEDGRHTYEGSSAPLTHSATYIYTMATGTETELLADGSLSINITGADENTVLMLLEYAEGRLVGFDARTVTESTVSFTPKAETDTISVMLRKGAEPTTETESIRLWQKTE